MKVLEIPEEKKDIFYKRQLYFSKLQELQGEWDQLIVLKAYKTIINIEAKKGEKLERLKESSDQTRKRLLIFKKVFGYLLSSEWKFVTAVCLPNLTDYDENDEHAPCRNCKSFIIDNKQLDDIKPWLMKFMHSESNCAEEEYNNLLAGIIGFMSLRETEKIFKLIIDPIDYNLKTAELLVGEENDITGENDKVRRPKQVEDEIRSDKADYSNEQIEEKMLKQLNNEKYLSYMLNPKQLSAVLNSSKFLIINGDFGTGKTFVLKERAKRCADLNKESRVAFINLSSLWSTKTLFEHLEQISTMDIIAKSDFNTNKNIHVISCNDLAQHYLKQNGSRKQTDKYQNINIFSLLESYLRHNKYDFIFIDELHTNKEHDDVDFFQHGYSFCVALKVIKENKGELMLNIYFKTAHYGQINKIRIKLFKLGVWDR